jgi:adenylate cyclase
VNVASRIQGLTKTVGRPLLVTEAVRNRAADSFAFEELPPQEVRGIEARVMIFAVTLPGAANPKSQSSNPK